MRGDLVVMGRMRNFAVRRVGSWVLILIFIILYFMKKICLIAAAMMGFVLSSVVALGQVDERVPGIYAMVEGESVPLGFVNGTTAVSTTGVLGVEVGKTKVSFKGTESGVLASGTFVMVIDPEKKAVTKTLKNYNPFIKSMTPSNLLVLPLTVVKEKRVYDEGMSIDGIKTSVQGRMDFEWEQVGDNLFEIRVQGLVPGEYGIVFRASKLAAFDYSAMFGFTVAE